MPIPFVLNDRPLSLLPNLAANSQLLLAVENAIRGWELPPLGMRLDGTVAIQDPGGDGKNLITFADTPKTRDVTTNLSAVCLRTANILGSQWETTGADIVFNPRTEWATDGRGDRVDVHDVLSHELGHAWGLAHTPLISASMCPGSSPGDTLGRSPSEDDLAGVRTLYDLPVEPGMGTLTGKVVTLVDAPVYGAHVVVSDADGIARLSVLTEKDGTFAIPWLPAGNYQVHAEPLNDPFIFTHLPAFLKDSRNPLLRDFRLAFAGGNVRPASISAVAGETVTVEPIRVEAKRPELVIQYSNWSWTESGPFVALRSIPLNPGRGGWMAIAGPGMVDVADTGLSFSGRGVAINYGDVRRNRSSSPPWVFLRVSVPYGAKPGPRTLFATGSNERAARPAIIEVVER
jgi:hypothetical protein